MDPDEGYEETEGEHSAELRRFLQRLLCELHRSGNFAFRTEKYINRVARVYNLNCTATLFPSRAILTFQHLSGRFDPSTSESYTFGISFAYSCFKLSLLEDLVYDIRKNKIDFDIAEFRLREIEEIKGIYNWYQIAAAYGIASFVASLLFFGGDILDGFFGLLFGLLVYWFEVISPKLPGLLEIESFVASFCISLIGSVVDILFSKRRCLLSLLLGGTVWLLPGVTITSALLEILGKLGVYGSSRLIVGTSTAIQLGFGLSVGYTIVHNTTSIPDSFSNGCRYPISPWFAFLLLPLGAMSFAVILGAKYTQFPGIIASATGGYIVSYFMTKSGASVAGTPFVAAVVATAVARIFAYFEGNKRPGVYIVGGLIMLVPGSVGVRGMFDMMSGDSHSGLSFTFKMLSIAVSLSIGVFVSSIPSKKWLPIRVQRSMSQDTISLVVVNPIIESRLRAQTLI